MDKRARDSIEGFFDYHMKQIQQCCNAFSTCEGCPQYKKHIGCYFRGKSPKDWKYEK